MDQNGESRTAAASRQRQRSLDVSVDVSAQKTPAPGSTGAARDYLRRQGFSASQVAEIEGIIAAEDGVFGLRELQQMDVHDLRGALERRRELQAAPLGPDGQHRTERAASPIRDEDEGEQALHDHNEHVDSQHGQYLPPYWFWPRDPGDEQRKRAKATRDLDIQSHERRCGEGWLISPIFGRLDSPMIWVPVHVIFLSMALLHPATIIYGSEMPTQMWNEHALPVRMHALATIFWWLKVLGMFRNLREVVRQRTSWLAAVAKKLGAHPETVEKAQSHRPAITAVIADQCKARQLAKVGTQVHLARTRTDLAERLADLHKVVAKHEDAQMIEVRAAIKLQARFRGYLARKFRVTEQVERAVFDESIIPPVVAEWDKLYAETAERGQPSRDDFQQLPQSDADVEPTSGRLGTVKLERTKGPSAASGSSRLIDDGMLRSFDGVFIDSVTNKFKRFLSQKQDVMPPSHRLGAMRDRVEVSGPGALARLRWAANERGKRCALVTLTDQQYDDLQDKRWVVGGVAILVLALFVCYGWIFMHPLLTDFVDQASDNSTTAANVLLVYSVFATLVAAVVWGLWLLSLLLAVALATDAIEDTCNDAKAWMPPQGILSDGLRGGMSLNLKGNWYELVQRPCLELVNTTLPALSAWGSTMGITFICGWAFALLSVPLAIAEFEERDNNFFRRLLLLLMVGVSAALPLLQLYAPARVSSSVIELLNQVNELRVRSEFSDKFALRRMERAAHLYNYLEKVNGRKGPGFIVGNTVVDLVFLRHALATIAALASSLLVYLTGLAHDDAA